MDELQLMQRALEAAQEAAALVLEGYRQRPSTRSKASTVDLVTEYDLASERLVRERLADTGIALVGEEEGGQSSTTGPVWYIDPIDGTTNFAHGHPMFCVSIGLFDKGLPVLGAVVAPALQVHWTGCPSRGAFRNGEPCRVSSSQNLGESLLSTGFAPGELGGPPHKNIGPFRNALPHVRGVRRDGSAALDLCMTADGTFDGYWELGLKPWDLAGGAAIALCAGATISGIQGEAPDYLAGDLVATNGLIHEALVGLLS